MHARARVCAAGRSNTSHAWKLLVRRLGTLVWMIVALAGCGGSTSTEATPGNPVDTSTLAGQWAGSVNGDDSPSSYGYTTTLTELRADSTLTLIAASQRYGNLTGVWTVSDGKWIASGRDRDNITIILTASLSPHTLTGTWTAGSGRKGVFTMAKLP